MRLVETFFPKKVLVHIVGTPKIQQEILLASPSAETEAENECERV